MLLGDALRLRFERSGEQLDIEEAIELLRLAAETTGDDDVDLPEILVCRAGALVARFEVMGNLADLDNGITALRTALKIDADEDEDLDYANPAILSNLGDALRLRFERLGERSDIDESIRVLYLAIDGLPHDDPDRPAVLANLGITLGVRARIGDPADLDESIDALRTAIDTDVPRGPRSALLHSNLGAALGTRFEYTEVPADLDDAIRAFQVAVTATPREHPYRTGYLTNLGNALRVRGERNQDIKDIGLATKIGEAAAAALSADHPDQALILSNLAFTLWTRYELLGDRNDADNALERWREAAHAATAPAARRMVAARAWGFKAASMGCWRNAVEGHATAAELLPLIAWRGVGRSSQERLLAEWPAVAADAAACAIADGQIDKAVELLEHGRGVLWSQVLQTRTDLTALVEHAPELAAQLDAVRAGLDQEPSADTTGLDHSHTPADHQIALAQDWDRLVGQVRTVPGFDRFLRPPAIERLRRLAVDGPVAIVNASQWRCDALVVTEDAIHHVPLPDLSHDDVAYRTLTYLTELDEFERSGQGDQAARDGLESTIKATLRWLWDTIAEPILADRGYHDIPEDDDTAWPRIWWCPTGLLTLLPLHAAGYHDPNDDRPGRSVLDRVISSYTPTLQALETNRDRPEHGTKRPRLALISLPDTPGLRPLPGAIRERAVLTALFTEDQYTVLADANATHEAIVTAAADHPWLHASCHGRQDLTNPTSGGLLPYNWESAGPVRIHDITHVIPTSGEFAFLSACKTAVGGAINIDEAMSLAAALRYTGWRHVIGTLWWVWDSAAANLTDSIYPKLVHHGELNADSAAMALHRTVRDLRKRNNNHAYPSRWAPFIHLGL